jgi:RNAse (barnase) inhibitor barstar
MNARIGQIQADPALNGLYRLDSPSSLLPSLDGSTLTDKDSLLEALGWALEFPDYFGANWDALEECLTDMSWRAGPITLHIAHADSLEPELLDMLKSVFLDAAAYWRELGRVCSLFLSGLENPDLPLAE